MTKQEQEISKYLIEYVKELLPLIYDHNMVPGGTRKKDKISDLILNIYSLTEELTLSGEMYPIDWDYGEDL